ncbi:MAG: hypothetical protein LBK27_02880, partial [Treponema sp.]|nr:hypothetical protein [Treponema sp.]
MAEQEAGVFPAVWGAGLSGSSVFPGRYGLSKYVLSNEGQKAYKTPEKNEEYSIHDSAVRIKKDAPLFIFGFPAFILKGKIPVCLRDKQGIAEGTYRHADKFQNKYQDKTCQGGNQQGLMRGGLQGNQLFNKREGKAERTARQGKNPLSGQIVRFLLGFYQLVCVALAGFIKLPIMFIYRVHTYIVRLPYFLSGFFGGRPIGV